MDLVSDDDIVVILVSNIILLYAECLQKRRKRKTKQKRLLAAGSRPQKYCLAGYNSKIYQAVLDNDNNIVMQHLRVTSTALHRIFELIPNKTHGWNKTFEVSVFLYWLGCGASYRVTAESFSISRYTVRDIVHKMLDVFLSLMQTVIKYPSPEKYSEIGQGFNRRAKVSIFSNALGAIDGSHVKVTVPLRLRDQYINRKLDTTVQLQAICGSDKQFFSICVGYPGSVHDQRVLRNSRVYRDSIFPPPEYYLLGDSGYKCAIQPLSIITPFKRSQPLTRPEERFNNVHSKARSVIESAFGLLKIRWRSIFKKPLELSLQNSVKTIAVACVMHNICLNDGFNLIQEQMEQSDDSYNINSEYIGEDDSQGITLRRTLMEQL